MRSSSAGLARPVRTDPNSWRIASTDYERIYEAMTSLEDTPSFKLIANRWDPDLVH